MDTFSKSAFKKSVLSLEMPKKMAIMPELQSDNYVREFKIRKRIISYGVVAAALVLAVLAGVLVPIISSNNPMIYDEGDSSNNPAIYDEGNSTVYIVVTADGLDEYVFYSYENVGNSGSSNSVNDFENEDSAALEDDGYVSDNSNASSNMNSSSSNSGEAESRVSKMLRAKMQEYDGKQVRFRVVVQYLIPAHKNMEDEIAKKLEYAKSIGAVNIVINENLPKNCRIMELTAEQIEMLDYSQLEIYLAASDEFYENYNKG